VTDASRDRARTLLGGGGLPQVSSYSTSSRLRARVSPADGADLFYMSELPSEQQN
jgi:hypothetical protein